MGYVMFNREILKSLRVWASSESRKPLVLRGARQVGKTTAINLFSKEFDQYIYLNLEQPGQIDFFRKNMSVRDVFSAILLSKNIRNTGGRRLLFIDEIQNSPEAIGYLRYFFEEMKDLHVCAAGSLLDAMISRSRINFPVGRVEFRYLYPLSFVEYLGARNNSQALDAFSLAPVPDYAIDVLFREFHNYALVGGMPEIVAAYAKNQDVVTLAPLYQDLMVSFLDDIPKYAQNQTLAHVMRHCLESTPAETGRRISFARFGKSEYRSREAGESLRTLERAMLLYLLHPSVSCEIPIVPDYRKSPRLQFLDTGFWLAAAGLQRQIMSVNNLHALYRGIVAEHIVGQELLAVSSDLQKKPCFWVRENPQANAEIDFIVAWRDIVVPVEVKSGSAGSLRSLHQFIDRCNHAVAVRLYYGKIDVAECATISGKKFKLLSLPYFLASKLPEYLDWAFQG
jgi:predicted AAA+ superfamily ATPase